MAITTCPGCNRYVEVPNINDSIAFKCPYCPKNAPNYALYKCTSCMKPSLLEPAKGPNACPKCSTLIRPDVRTKMRPKIMAPPSLPSDWTYHTTNTFVAHAIKKQGLRSAFMRTGSDQANPKGAFIRNRNEMLSKPVTHPANPIVQQLKKAVAYLHALGMPLNAVEQLQLVQQFPITFNPTGHDNDRPNLDIAQEQALQAIAKSAGISSQPQSMNKAPNFFKVWRDGKVKLLSQKLATQQNHCLTDWASQYVTLYYRCEEVKTARHVYFLKYKDAIAGYNEYTKGVSKADIIVLRVRKSNIQGLKDDISESKAECTLQAVPSMFIEVMVGALNPDSFRDNNFRHDDGNWVNISQWGV